MKKKSFIKTNLYNDSYPFAPPHRNAYLLPIKVKIAYQIVLQPKPANSIKLNSDGASANYTQKKKSLLWPDSLLKCKEFHLSNDYPI